MARLGHDGGDLETLAPVDESGPPPPPQGPRQEFSFRPSRRSIAVAAVALVVGALVGVALGRNTVHGRDHNGASAGTALAAVPLAPTPTTEATTTRYLWELAGLPCPFNAPSCTTEQVRTTMTTLIKRSGTTTTEATCLASLLPPAHSMIEEWRSINSSLNAAATRCVRSSARLDAIAGGVTATLARIDPQFARSVNASGD
jgi:hypothetical protein